MTTPRRLFAPLLAILACALAGSAAEAATVKYYHLDAVDNVLAVTRADGAVLETHDYLPYGEEWCAGAICGSNRTPGQPLRVTGKERDTETGLDYFGARYYGSRIGRFTTTDPAMTLQANIADPQRWNRYASSRNNPLRFVDPDGRDWRDSTGGFAQGAASGYVNLLLAPVMVNLAFASDPAGFVQGAIQNVRSLGYAGDALDQYLDMATSQNPADHAALGSIIGSGTVTAGAVVASGKLGPSAEVSTLKPGPFAGESIALRGAGRNFSAAERAAIDRIGGQTGCHTCGTTTAGTQSGHFIVDHQPPIGLAPAGGSFRGYPHCTGCSFPRQANEVKAAMKQSP